MKRLFLAAVALALSACAAQPTPPPGTAGAEPAPTTPTAIERASAAFVVAEASYLRLREWSFDIEAFLPDTWRARLIRARSLADKALAAARVARTLAEQARALSDLTASAAAMRAVATR